MCLLSVSGKRMAELVNPRPVTAEDGVPDWIEGPSDGQLLYIATQSRLQGWPESLRGDASVIHQYRNAAVPHLQASNAGSKGLFASEMLNKLTIGPEQSYQALTEHLIAP